MANGHAPSTAPAKAVHVNMMTDTIIANMPPDGLRAIMRGLLGADVNLALTLHTLAAQYLVKTTPATIPTLFATGVSHSTPVSAFFETQSRYRCLMGCGKGFGCVEILCAVVKQTQALAWDESTKEGQQLLEIFASIDGDVVQAVTAVQKELSISSGLRDMSSREAIILDEMAAALTSCKEATVARGQEFAFDRGFWQLQKARGISGGSFPQKEFGKRDFVPTSSLLETIQLGEAVVPRMFMGLWQFSSPAWGSASKSKINRHFRKHVDAGFTAYDMADHYGDAEVTFGQFRSSQPDGDKIYCATKWAVFQPIKISKATVDANITERLANINSDAIDLLQFHWQDWHDHQYVEAVKLIGEDARVKTLGLVNFDTEHMDEILQNDLQIASNQVQFSLIDLRPTFKMAASCRKYNVKLLTYGSLCGGFLADKWHNKPAPNLFDNDMTPSHRKYLEMIIIWGGWALFQELLACLAKVAQKYNVSISNVAVRWILDHDYVGAVIVGARMGISEHTQENLVAFSFKLDNDDQASIQSILARSKARDIFEAMGDCGSEYR